uniref:Putative Resolvase, N terminal domain protein n=1 Tax=uncultured marine microorganism HF4000_005H07 TaxID=455506 RepID=B3T0G2_9ZZZZ|nr:putative Resolvase, N terminal domain protein [uncultured marine microorganism HF4000_005H07]
MRRSRISPKRRENPRLSQTLGRPILWPCRRARSIPALTLSRIISSSNSAREARRLSNNRPRAVEVSNCSLKLLKPTPTTSQAARVSCMCLTERKARSNLKTRTTPNLRLAASSSRSRHLTRWARSLAGALSTYSRVTSQPWAAQESRIGISWVSGS